MDRTEALEWLAGERSTNAIPQDPFETWIVRTEQADAAKMQQAYWVLRAHTEGLVPQEPDHE